MKKLLSLIVALCMMLTLVGCGSNYDFQSRFDLVFKDVDASAVEANLSLPTKVGNLLIEWESSNPEVISNTGEVKRAKEDVKVTLKAHMTYEKETETLSIELTVKGIGEVVLAKNTIKEVIDGETDKEYEVAGTVVAYNAQSFVIKDETGAVMSYHGNSFAKDVKIGDVVLLTGTTTVYGAAKQFKNATYSVIGTDEVNDGEPKEYTAAEYDTLVNTYGGENAPTYVPEYVKVTGVVEISGNYTNLKIDGTTKATGSLVYPIDQEAMGALNGKTIEVVAYLTGVTGTKYLQFIFVSYKEVEGSPVEPPKPADEKTIAEIVAGEDGNYKTTAVVVGVNAQSFLIKDETGIMLVYKGATWSKDLKIGDKVKVEGATSVYGAAKQFGATCTYEKVGTETVEHGTAKELSAADADAYLEVTTVTPEYVKVTGKLSVSNGKYFNIAIEGATIIGSATYPLDVDAVSALDGKDVDVVGYVTGVSGSTTKYLNILFTEIKVVGDQTDNPGNGDEPVLEGKTIAEIIAAENGSFETTGVVVGFNAQSFLIKDETGIIMVYCGKSYAKDLAVGDKVKVSGETTVYGAAKQFGAGSTYEKIESVTVDHGQAAELTAAELDAYATMSSITPKFVKVKGTLAVSGNYFNLNIEGTTAVVGSLVYPVDTEALSALDGKELDVTAYLTGLTGVKYLQLVVVEYNAGEGEVTPQPNPNPSEQADAVISFADVANRTAFSAESQVWEQNGIKVTNNKASATSDVADYSNPVRFYKNTEVVIECAQNIAKIVITTAGESKYQIKADYTFDGATLSVDGKVATLVLNAAANSYTFVCANSQIRVASIEVYYAK